MQYARHAQLLDPLNVVDPEAQQKTNQVTANERKCVPIYFSHRKLHAKCEYTKCIILSLDRDMGIYVQNYCLTKWKKKICKSDDKKINMHILFQHL